MEKTLSSEENDILQRSNKKFKRVASSSHLNEEMEISRVPCSLGMAGQPQLQVSYSQAAKGFGSSKNPLFEKDNGEEDCFSEEDMDSDDDADDASCPTIKLTRDEKRRIRIPWKNSLIIKLFDRKLGYEFLMRRLKAKWNLKGEIALTDVGHAYYVV